MARAWNDIHRGFSVSASDWYNTAPIPVADASVATQNGALKLGNASGGRSARTFFKREKASRCAGGAGSILQPPVCSARSGRKGHNDSSESVTLEELYMWVSCWPDGSPPD